MEALESSGGRPHVPIEGMELYRLFDEVSDWCWDVVETWPPRAQRIVGDQLNRAADSVCANLVEGDGRYGVKDGVNFFRIARASAREARMWLRKAAKRKLITPGDEEHQVEKLTSAVRMLNALIAYRQKRGAFLVKEEHVTYDADPFSAVV